MKPEKCGLQNIFCKPHFLFSPVAKWVNASRKKYFASRIFLFFRVANTEGREWVSQWIQKSRSPVEERHALPEEEGCAATV
ncbi:MAG: hypothetical protein J6K05_08665 [Bacteroidaceae bacterium]|nr:hypothetical protein [Bacteroidaceae bacterium]